MSRILETRLTHSGVELLRAGKLTLDPNARVYGPNGEVIRAGVAAPLTRAMARPPATTRSGFTRPAGTREPDWQTVGAAYDVIRAIGREAGAAVVRELHARAQERAYQKRVETDTRRYHARLRDGQESGHVGDGSRFGWCPTL